MGYYHLYLTVYLTEQGPAAIHHLMVLVPSTIDTSLIAVLYKSNRAEYCVVHRSSTYRVRDWRGERATAPRS